MRKPLLASALLFLSAVFLSRSTHDPADHALAAAQIADRKVSAGGGEAALREDLSMTLPVKIEAGENQNIQQPVVLQLKRPRKAQIEPQFQGQTAVQVYDGNTGRKIGPSLDRYEVEPYTSGELVQTAASSERFAAPAQEPLPLPPSPPPSPEVAPNTLHVTYEGEQLTIAADNSTLSEILAEVRARTGAEIDVPASASGERIEAVRLGPGPAREVLVSLLSGTNFDYIIQASETNPQGLQSVLLVARSKTEGGAAAGTALASARQPHVAAPRRVAEPNPIPAETENAENPVPPQPATSAGAAPAEHQVVTPAAESNSSRPQPGTTQEMIQELQRMYQQRRQIQQEQKRRTGI